MNLLTKINNGCTWLNKALRKVCFLYNIEINIQQNMTSRQQQISISGKNDAKWHENIKTVTLFDEIYSILTQNKQISSIFLKPVNKGHT